MKKAIVLWGWLIFMGTFPVAAAPASNQETASRVVERFYGIYQKMGVSGLPDRKQTQALQPFLCASLGRLLALAKEGQAAEIKRHPDEKPPWDEGDLFSSLFEGPQRYQVTAAAVTGQGATVPVRLEYGDGKNIVRWTDTFVLKFEGGGWRIFDVKMGGKWAFKQGETLRKILAVR